MSILGQLMYSPPSYREWSAAQDHIERAENALGDVRERLRQISWFAQQELSPLMERFSRRRLDEIVTEWTPVRLVNADTLPDLQMPARQVWVEERRYRKLDDGDHPEVLRA